LRVDPQHGGRTYCQIHEATVIANFAVAKQPRQQGQGVLGEDLVHEGFLPIQGFKSATAWFSVIVEIWVTDFREEFDRGT
jgi:hypothetical protein